MAPVVVLVGAPGCGKTTVGRALAATLGVEFRDTDTDIEQMAGKPIPEIFIDEGEAHFRTLERAAVAAALAAAEGTRAALIGHRVVHLSVELPDAVRRVGLGAGRPLLAINPRATLKHLLDQRRPLYAEVATETVVTDGRAPAQVVAEVAALLPR